MLSLGPLVPARTTGRGGRRSTARLRRRKRMRRRERRIGISRRNRYRHERLPAATGRAAGRTGRRTAATPRGRSSHKRLLGLLRSIRDANAFRHTDVSRVTGPHSPANFPGRLPSVHAISHAIGHTRQQAHAGTIAARRTHRRRTAGRHGRVSRRASIGLASIQSQEQSAAGQQTTNNGSHTELLH